MYKEKILEIITRITNTFAMPVKEKSKRGNERKHLVSNINGREQAWIEFYPAEQGVGLTNTTEVFARAIYLSLELVSDGYMVMIANDKQVRERLENPENSYFENIALIMDKMKLPDDLRNQLARSPKTLEILMNNYGLNEINITHAELKVLMKILDRKSL